MLRGGRQVWVCSKPGTFKGKGRHLKAGKGKVKKMARVQELTHTEKLTGEKVTGST